jgi:hypothetical protein
MVDDRKTARQRRGDEDHEPPGVAFVAGLLIWGPLLALVAFAYVSGTWVGGWQGGVFSVLSAAATVGIVWLFQRRRRR